MPALEQSSSDSPSIKLAPQCRQWRADIAWALLPAIRAFW
jgi:hypothetical protein